MKMVRWPIVSGMVGGVFVCAALVGQRAQPTTYASEAPIASVPSKDSDEARRPVRTRSGLVALYDFHSAEGAIVKDRSGVGQPLDLRIANFKAVRRTEGSLEVRGKTVIRSAKPATKIVDAVRRSGEITIEAWIRPAKLDLSGPARIVTLSKSGNERDFTLGQDGNRFDVRFRTNDTSTNGLPSLSTPRKSLTEALTHVVYTRDRTGRTRIYIDGKLRADETVSGTTNSWDDSHRLALADELTGNRSWLGTYHLVAIYARDLLPYEVQEHHKAGARASVVLAKSETAQGDELFDEQIAGLFVQHCLECHDSATKKGELDLSRKDTAFIGGESGAAIVPGSAAESLLWEYVESDAMPAERPALSPDEKRLLKQWLDEGAHWSTEVIDPATYAREGVADGNWVRRLTVPEYIATVQSAVGVDISKEARAILPPDLRADGFSNTAYNLNVDLKHVEAYARLAEIIVERMDVAEFASKHAPCRLLTDDCMRGEVIPAIGQWLLRGPLEEHEITAFRGISTTVASAGGDFDEAVRYIVEAMLQSPRFIYRIENQRGDGTAWPVGEFELASRLSYLLWGAPPDEELMRAADSGELYDRGAVGAQVRRMLKDPRAVERSSQFVHEWLNLARLDHLRPNADRFPSWSDELAADMREETLAFFKDVAWEQDRPLSELLNAQYTFATPRLARHYGIEPSGESLARYDLAAVPGRGGLLSHGSVLTVGGDEASMVARGLFVLHELLRGTVKDPPPCVDTTPIPTQPGLTQRGIAEARLANAACGGCHARFEPLAFGLEKFDGIGAYHEADEHGNRLRDDGEILIPGGDKPHKYESSAELMDLLASSDRVRECITWKLTQFALGRPLGAADAAMVDRIHAEAQKGGGTYTSLIMAIVKSDLVRTTLTEASE